MNKVSKKQREELALRKKVKAELIKEHGEYCMKCGSNGDFRGIQLCHKIPLSQGGKTDTKNCYLGCGKCHMTRDHHIREVN